MCTQIFIKHLFPIFTISKLPQKKQCVFQISVAAKGTTLKLSDFKQ